MPVVNMLEHVSSRIHIIHSPEYTKFTNGSVNSNASTEIDSSTFSRII